MQRADNFKLSALFCFAFQHRAGVFPEKELSSIPAEGVDCLGQRLDMAVLKGEIRFVGCWNWLGLDGSGWVPGCESKEPYARISVGIMCL